jgi:multiple antibiotic resistance protein
MSVKIERLEGDQGMPSYDLLLNAFITILVTIDPPGLAPLYLAVTRGMNREQRSQVSMRASIIAFFILALFALVGNSVLALLGITLPAFRVAGGLLLFFIAFEMVFEKRNDRKEKTAETAITKDHVRNVAAFPLAIPLIAGPAPFRPSCCFRDVCQPRRAKRRCSPSSCSVFS